MSTNGVNTPQPYEIKLRAAGTSSTWQGDLSRDITVSLREKLSLIQKLLSYMPKIRFPYIESCSL